MDRASDATSGGWSLAARSWPSCPGLQQRLVSLRAGVLWLLALLFAGPAGAQMTLEVSGVGASQYPIAIASFEVDGEVPEDVAGVVRTDLQRSGIFRIINPGVTLSDTATIDYAPLRTRGADALVVGSIKRLADGRFDIRYRLVDAVRQSNLGGEAILASRDNLRYAGHRIADTVYQRLTGEKAVFTTRIAFVTRQGDRYRLNISDWDGQNIQTSLTSPEPIISPSWSPDGSRLAYVSFETRKPVVYVHTLATGKRIPVADFRGSNSAPAWSPDGRSLAVALTRDGTSQIYMVSAEGGSTPRRLVSSSGIDTEPQFSPDGKYLYFSSDRGGSPQIYRAEIDGGRVGRVTFDSAYNVSPRISPDGSRLAFLTRRNDGYYVAIKDLESGTETLLSAGGREESPSFAPNGRWVMYATRATGRDMLMATSIDGRITQRISSDSGDIREPTWGPFEP
ncbi:MAG: Tol-Pal system beta propeller repeat protein TolB [Burkholderiaceae bacterium]